MVLPSLYAQTGVFVRVLPLNSVLNPSVRKHHINRPRHCDSWRHLWNKSNPPYPANFSSQTTSVTSSKTVLILLSSPRDFTNSFAVAAGAKGSYENTSEIKKHHLK